MPNTLGRRGDETPYWYRAISIAVNIPAQVIAGTIGLVMQSVILRHFLKASPAAHRIEERSSGVEVAGEQEAGAPQTETAEIHVW